MLFDQTSISPDTAGIQWHNLTRSDRKRQIFQVDADFRYAVHRIRSAGLSVERIAYDYGLILLKPETFYGRVVADGLAFLEAKGFEVAWGRFGEFNNSIISRVWRYHFNAATPCRLDLIFDVLRRRPIGVFLIRQRGAELPTTLLLSAVKGSGLSEKRDPQSLRGFFKGANSFLNFVHVSDEPADVLREIPALLDQDGLEDWLTTCANEEQGIRRAALMAELPAIYAGLEASDNDPDQACSRLAVQAMHAGAPLRLTQQLAAAQSDRMLLEARQLIDDLRPYRGQYSDWDLYLTLSEYTQRVYEGVEQTIGKVGLAAWTSDQEGPSPPAQRFPSLA